MRPRIPRRGCRADDAARRPTMKHLTLTAAALVMLAAATASAQDLERCYGIAPAGTAEGVGDEERAGSGEVDFQGDAWVRVPAGTCMTEAAPIQADGTPRRGSLEPLDRDRP